MGGRRWKIYSSIFTLKENALVEKKADIFERTIICKEKECNRYELKNAQKYTNWCSIENSIL